MSSICFVDCDVWSMVTRVFGWRLSNIVARENWHFFRSLATGWAGRTKLNKLTAPRTHIWILRTISLLPTDKFSQPLETFLKNVWGVSPTVRSQQSAVRMESATVSKRRISVSRWHQTVREQRLASISSKQSCPATRSLATIIFWCPDDW